MEGNGNSSNSNFYDCNDDDKKFPTTFQFLMNLEKDN